MSSHKYATVPVAVDAFLIGIASLALVLRFVSRYLSGAGFWWDDWLALAAWPFSATICVSFLVAGFHGFGNHEGDPKFFLHVLYYDEIWYNMGIALTKLSVLCFYYRIFNCSRRFTRILWAIGIFVVLWWISFEMASILQCIPVKAYWQPDIKAVCVEKFAFFIGQAVPNIAADFVLLILPLKALWKLKMQRIQKSALFVVFVLGYFNPLISILRIVSFIQLGRKTGEDINYNFIGPALWSAAEVAIAIFSCSIPSMTHLFRKIIGSSRKGGDGNPSCNGHFSRIKSDSRVGRDTGRVNNPKEAFRHKMDGFSFTTKALAEVGGCEKITVEGQSPYGPGQICVSRDIDIRVYEA